MRVHQPLNLVTFILMASVDHLHATMLCYESHPRAECSELGLTKVPTNLNSRITSLDLSKNPIRHLRPTDFASYTELETLLLSDCQLIHLPEVIFGNQRKLTMIDLARNQLSSIPSKIFQNNKSLRYVVLDLNELLPLMLHSPFLKSVSLERLSMSGCGIKYIFDETFSGLPNLKDLDLSGNPIQTISTNAFRNNILKHLWIDSADSLKHVAHKLCKDEVEVDNEVGSMLDQLCTKDSSSLETKDQIQGDTTHSLTGVTKNLELYSLNYNNFNQSETGSSTSPNLSVAASSLKPSPDENSSTVGTKRTIGFNHSDVRSSVSSSLSIATSSLKTSLDENSSTVDTKRTIGFNHSDVRNTVSSSLSSSPMTFHESSSTVDSKRTTDSTPKDVQFPSIDDDEGILLRTGKTELWFISEFILIGFFILILYRYVSKIPIRRASEVTSDHADDSPPSLQMRQMSEFSSDPEVVYVSLPQESDLEVPVRTSPSPPPTPLLHEEDVL